MDLFVEALFGMIFIRSLVAYVRRPTPLHRDVMVMFSAMAVLFILAVARQLIGEPPELVGGRGHLRWGGGEPAGLCGLL